MKILKTIPVLILAIFCIFSNGNAQEMSREKCGYFMPMNWSCTMPDLFTVTINQEALEMTVISLSSDFAGISSISVHDEFHCGAEPICGPVEFIVPWHPQYEHVVPIPETFFECNNATPYIWSICYLEEFTNSRFENLKRTGH